MIPVVGYAGRRVGILGLGRSGRAAARALAAGGAEVVGWDDRADARSGAGDLAIEDLTRPREAAALALLVVSPGIPHLYPAPHPAVLAARAAGVPLDNEIGLFFAALPALAGAEPAPRVVAITGSNGKSTTTALLHHVLRTAGRPAQMGGNIGRAALDLDPPAPGETVVLELSSYQIELAAALAPDIGVFLNLAPDHLDRHGGMGGYFAAKRRLFDQGAPEMAIVGIDEPEGLALANATEREALIAVSAARRLRGGEGWPPWSVFMGGTHLSEWRRGRQVAALDLRGAAGLPGRHNHQNACAAYAAARALGLGPKAIEAGLLSFAGLPHRMERLGEERGVLWVNDSKATNAAATARALAAYERVHLILGGRAKEDGILPLAPLFPRIAHAWLIGEAAERFAAELGSVPHTLAGTLAAAVAGAAGAARPGETVLFSPAAASFDQFADFEARGEAFRALARPHLETPT